MIKNNLKYLVNLLGFDVHRINPRSDSASQILAALNLCKIDLVFDVGANIGQFASEIRSRGFKGKIVSFEPLSDAHEQLTLAAGNDPNWVVHSQVAIGGEDGEVIINISNNSVSSSILPMLNMHSAAEPNSLYVASEKVASRKLDTISPAYLSPSDNLFIKIDTQGYESVILDGASATLGRAQGLLCELSLVPLYDGQRLWLEIIERLESHGFTLWALQKGFTDADTGRTLQVDAIFLRQP